MSDHKIVGGCSTLLAKSNKKMHFSRPDYIPCSRNRIKKCIFRDQCLVYIKKMLDLCSRKSLEKGAVLVEKSYQKGVRAIKI